MIVPLFIAIDGQFEPTALYGCPLSWSNLVYRIHVRIFYPIGKLCADVEIFAGQLIHGAQCNAEGS